MDKKQWQYSTLHSSPCQVLESQNLWGETTCQIWLPNQDSVVRVPASTVVPLGDSFSPEKEAQRISYITAATKVAQILEGGVHTEDGPVLLAPMDSNVIPLPHQLSALKKVISGDRVRYLLADEVGLGKTIEAGLVIRELKLRGLAKRILVLAPKSLATQWVSEMQTHFNESFQLIVGEDLNTLDKIASSAYSGYWAKNTQLHRISSSEKMSSWSIFDQVIVSHDSVKPLDKRRGWTKEKIAEFNRQRFEGLVNAGWDLIIVDEAHRLGGSTEQVARYKLGLGLSEAAPYLLLLSATPHQGKSDAFHRIMALLDNMAFPDAESVTRESVAPYIVRTEKRFAVDAEGNPLFKPRKTEIAPIKWEDRHSDQQLLYEQVTEYVREGYNKAVRDKKRHIGFLMVLMQRLVVSSTKAIKSTLQKRLEILKDNRSSLSSQLEILDENPEQLAEYFDLSGEESLELLIESERASADEVSQVEMLLSLAERCDSAGIDAKTEALLDWIFRLEVEEKQPELKVLIFTEFVPTQKMLAEQLRNKGISVVELNGSLSMEERKQVQADFKEQARVLISTDAGGEGLNLQFCHVIFNYDIPWNPMRLEQRIGRVDRIGQPHIVRAINFVFEDSVEFRVREVLEEKLQIIMHEFGVDKTGDVLDSAEAGQIFEELFAAAYTNPDEISTKIDSAVDSLKSELESVRENSVMYGLSDTPELNMAGTLKNHPLSHWIERMTVNYLRFSSCTAEKKRTWWELQWLDGQRQSKAVFHQDDYDRLSDATLVSLEDSRVRGMCLNIPIYSEGMVIPEISINGLSQRIDGFWAIFEVRINMGGDFQFRHVNLPQQKKDFFPVYANQEGKCFTPTAHHVWHYIQNTIVKAHQSLPFTAYEEVLTRLRSEAEIQGQEIFLKLKASHEESVARERKRGEVSFNARWKAIQSVGLPEVRQHREKLYHQDYEQWQKELEMIGKIIPEIRTLLVAKILPGAADE